MDQPTLFRLARLGAERELLELRQRARMLEGAFPGIKQSLRKTILQANMAKARAVKNARKKA